MTWPWSMTAGMPAPSPTPADCTCSSRAASCVSIPRWCRPSRRRCPSTRAPCGTGRRWPQRLGEDIELAVTGGLMVAESREQYEFLEKKCRREQQLGLEVEMLDRAALDRIAPYFAAEHRRRRTVRHRGQGQSAAGQPGDPAQGAGGRRRALHGDARERPRPRRRTASRSRPAAARSAPAASSSPPAPGPARWPTISASKCRRAPSRCT